jgi:hypothetical protein
MNQAYEAVLGKMHNNSIFIHPVNFYLFTMYQELVTSTLQIELFSDTLVLCILLWISFKLDIVSVCLSCFILTFSCLFCLP